MRLIKSLSCLAIVGALFAFAEPAGAHTAAVTGVASCSDRSHLVTWTITNGLATKPMTVTATSTASGVAYGVSVVTNPVPGGGSTKATTVVPGAVTGSIKITVVGRWPDEFSKTVDATVGLPTSCSPTETTAPPTTAPPTTAPPTTGPTETTAPTPTSGGVAPSSIVPTTAPAGVAGVSTTPSGALPSTGASDAGTKVSLGIGLLVAGAGLLALKRRPAQRVS